MHAGATVDLAHGGVRHAEGDKLQEEAYVERQIIREGQELRASLPARVSETPMGECERPRSGLNL